MSLTKTLNQLREGRFMSLVDSELSRVVEAVEETGKSGSITLTINVKTTGGRKALVVTGDVKSKVPAPPIEGTLMFSGPDGQLLTEDPRQTKLDLKPVESAQPSQLRDVAG